MNAAGLRCWMLAAADEYMAAARCFYVVTVVP